MERGRNLIMTSTKIIKDHFNMPDEIAMQGDHKGWRSEIVGKNALGETLFTAENRLVIGGSFWVLGALFGVEAPFKVDYLNDIMGIATGGEPITETHPAGMRIQLFGLGTSGADESISNVYPVSVKERTIDEMVPFRVTDSLTPEEQAMYFFKKDDVDTGKSAYYLKTFASEPEMRALWVDAKVEGEDGSPVQSGVHLNPREDAIETFVEMPLHISARDIREWFEANGEIEKTRFNTLAIYSGVLADCGGYMDYKNVTMVAKFNIPNEMLLLNKDMTIYYRVYSI